MIVNFSITAPDFHICRLEWRKFKSEDEGVLVLNDWAASSDIINIKYLNVRKIRKQKVMPKYAKVYIYIVYLLVYNQICRTYPGSDNLVISSIFTVKDSKANHTRIQE